MSRSDHDAAGAPAKKASLFEVLNRPISLSFRTARPTVEPAERAESDAPAPVAPDQPVGLRDRLRRTRQNLVSGLSGWLVGKKLDDAALEELENRLLLADVGVEVTERLMQRLQERAARQPLADAAALLTVLKEELLAILGPCQQPWQPSEARPYAILMVGVNGAGKTTTIGKLAQRLQATGHSVLLAAGDTFRAAAVEQLQAWGERNQVSVIAQHGAADAASVIYDALSAAKARGVEVVIADTAGRLHTQSHLMEELKKIKRVMAKVDATAPHEVLLVVDASAGQNALNQAVQFHEAVGLTGLIVTKLDGTAKGGTLAAVAAGSQGVRPVPVYWIGVGESLHDLQPFSAAEFASALLG